MSINDKYAQASGGTVVITGRQAPQPDLRKPGNPSLSRSHGLRHLDGDQLPPAHHEHKAERHLFTVLEGTGSSGHGVLQVAQKTLQSPV